MTDRTRTLIKIDGPGGLNLHYVAVTAGEAQPTNEQCPKCSAIMYQFRLYVWKATGPDEIYQGRVCSGDTCE